MTLIETNGLTKQYGKVLSVNNLDLAVPEGSIYGFLGPVCGLAGSFLGLMSAFFPYAVARLLPWGYYGLMATVHVQWDQYELHHVVPYEAVVPQMLDVGCLALWTVVFVTIGWVLFARKEV